MHDLLEYNSTHKVLICKECKYAIQKSAVDSHLLRHKIYRGDRRQLLTSIAEHDLPEPDDVQLPRSDCPPVEGLPVIAGYKCTDSGCGSLFASSKRLRCHWSERHGIKESPHLAICSVNIQTFFRGTKLKYFEVASDTAQQHGSPDCDEERSMQQSDTNSVAEPLFFQESSADPRGSLRDSDLNTLRYFHHFTTTTSRFLPVEAYWQIVVVEQALQTRWLMCGLLAISASHMATLSDNETTRALHRKRTAELFQAFTSGWNELKCDANMAVTGDAQPGAQINCVRRCIHWTYHSLETDRDPSSEVPPFGLRLFTATIRGCADPSYALYSALAPDSILEDTSNHARDGVEASSSNVLSSKAPPALLQRLQSLPYRMAEAIGRPEHALDFYATLSAIDALVDCCSRSYASDDVGAVWMGMGCWLSKCSDHYHSLVRRRDAAALVVFAHFAFLVKRAERYCWFLQGLAKSVLNQIIADLPEDRTVHDLVQDLVGGTSESIHL